MIARAGPPSVHALGLAAAGAALLAAAVVLPLGLFECSFRAATGLPCLTCGCTHAFHWFVRGDFGASFAASPLGALLALACVVHAGWTALRLCGLPWAPRLPSVRPAWAAALLGANWLFVALR